MSTKQEDLSPWGSAGKPLEPQLAKDLPVSRATEEPCGYCPPGLPCTERASRKRAARGACLRYYSEENLSPVVCPPCGERLPLATANRGERRHPTCHPAEENRP